jgi:hypothetical protein
MTTIIRLAQRPEGFTVKLHSDESDVFSNLIWTLKDAVPAYQRSYSPQTKQWAINASQKAKGKSHQAAVRALAYKWIRIIYRCWQTNKPYNEVKYLESLRKKGSPLLSFAASSPT